MLHRLEGQKGPSWEETFLKKAPSPIIRNIDVTNLNCFLFNARSIVNKWHSLELFVYEHDPDLIFITESWGKHDNVFNLPGYVTFRNDRENRPGGGVLIFIRSQLKPIFYSPNIKYSESVIFDIQCGALSFCFVCFYRSPDASPDSDRCFLDQIEEIMNRHCGVTVLLGDFNLPDINWDNFVWPPRLDSFMNIIMDHFLSQMVLEPTHQNGNILDLIFTDDTDVISTVNILENFASSDHFVINFQVAVNNSSKPIPIPTFNFWKANWQLYREHLQLLDWDTVFSFNSADDIWKAFQGNINSALSISVPKRSVKPASNKFPWFNDLELQHLTRKKSNIFRAYKRAGRPEILRLRLREVENLIRNRTRSLVAKFEQDLANGILQGKKPFWKYVSMKRKNRPKITALKAPDGNMVSTDTGCAEILSNFFASVFVNEDTTALPQPTVHTEFFIDNVIFSADAIMKVFRKLPSFSAPGPDNLPYAVLKQGGNFLAEKLSMLFQILLTRGTVPTEWKMAYVVPIFKKGSVTEPTNFRPVSLTISTCKVMESVIRNVIWPFWDMHHLISCNQHGFRPKCSCTTQMLEFLEQVSMSIDQGENIDVVYLDFRKAFDTVPHARLLSKLESLGIRGQLLMWIQSFLTNRSQMVMVNGVLSSPQRVLSGVPQGSVLGPAFFLAYVNDLESYLLSKVKLYADDTKVFSSSPFELQTDLDALTVWSDLWLLRFNLEKCVVMHCGHNNPNTPYLLNDHQLRTTDVERDLGIMVAKNLKSADHVNYIVARAQRIFGLIKKTFVSRDASVIMPLYCSLVRSLLDYGTVIWNPYLIRDIQLVEKVQRRVTRTVRGLRNLPYEERLVQLQIDSLEKRRVKTDLTELFKIINGYTCLQPEHFFNFNVQARTRGHNFKIYPNFSHLNVRKYFFTNRVVELWNRLPIEIVNAINVVNFKKLLNEYFSNL